MRMLCLGASGSSACRAPCWDSTNPASQLRSQRAKVELTAPAPLGFFRSDTRQLQCPQQARGNARGISGVRPDSRTGRIQQLSQGTGFGDRKYRFPGLEILVEFRRNFQWTPRKKQEQVRTPQKFLGLPPI